MDFLNEVEKKLDLPPADKKEIMRELESHYQELIDELVTSGIDAGQAREEAIRRLGEPGKVAADLRTVHYRKKWNELFPPKDFPATSVMFGIWITGIMAGVNYFRLGRRDIGKRVIWISIILEIFLCSLGGIFSGHGGELFSCHPHASAANIQGLLMLMLLVFAPGGLLLLPYGSVLFSWIAYMRVFDGIAGYWLYKMQIAEYRQWVKENPPTVRRTPYLKWWVTVLALVGASVIIYTAFILAINHI